MNREEALEIINGIERHLANQGMTDEEYSLDEALVTLGVYKQPDPITGLVPCGCKGKPEYISTECTHVASIQVFAQCKVCGARTAEYQAYLYTPDFITMLKFKVMNAWNTMRGYKEYAK